MKRIKEFCNVCGKNFFCVFNLKHPLRGNWEEIEEQVVDYKGNIYFNKKKIPRCPWCGSVKEQ